MEFLFLNEQDMVKAEALNMDKCLEKVEEAFSLLGKGDYLMGGPDGNSHGLMLWFPKESPHPNMPLAGPDRRFMSLIAYLGGVAINGMVRTLKTEIKIYLVPFIQLH